MLNSKVTLQIAYKAKRIQQFVKEIGKPQAIMSMAEILIKSRDYLDYEVDENKLASWAEMLVDEHPDLSFDDFILILRNGINGRYGKIYGKMNYPILSEWISKYRDQVAEYREQEIRNRRHYENQQATEKAEAIMTLLSRKPKTKQ